MFHSDCNPESELSVLSDLDWQNYSESVPYEVIFDSNEGRYLRATRDIKRGELALEESVLVRGPVKNTIPVCLSCYNELDPENVVVCWICNFPFCSEECQQFEEHQQECSIFAKQNVKIKNHDQFDYSSSESAYDLILPLRMLYLKSSDPDKWKQFWKLSSHIGNFKKKNEWVDKQKYVVDYILNTLKLPDITEDIILTILGIIHVNGVTGHFSGTKIQLIHPLASLLSHDCNPNVMKYFGGISEGNHLQCKAAVDIQMGQKLTVSYIDPLIPNIIRQKILNEEYNFECKCQRCADSTDLETNGNSLLCPKCCTSEAILKPSEWKCNKCSMTMNHSEVLDINQKAYDDTLELLSHWTKWTVEGYEEFLSKYSKKLHPNHLFNISIKTKLAGFYGKLSGYTMQDAQYSGVRDHIDRKLELCKESLEVLEKILPGLSSVKGLLLNELNMAINYVTQLDTDPDYGPSNAQQAEIMKAYKYLEESIDLLQHEQEGTFENALFTATVVGLLRSGYGLPEELMIKYAHLKYSAGGY